MDARTTIKSLREVSEKSYNLSRTDFFHKAIYFQKRIFS